MNQNFIRYATGTVFAINLSKAQVRALVGLSVPEDRLTALLNLPHHATPEALIRKGLVEYKEGKPILTDPGKLVLKLLDEAGLVPKGRAKLKLDILIEELLEVKSDEQKKKYAVAIHYDYQGKPVCKMHGSVTTTNTLKKVTCKICKQTEIYRTAVEAA